MQLFRPPQLEGFRGAYARMLAASSVPLRVTAVLDSPLYAPDAPMLDGLLAAAVVREVYQGSLIPDVPVGASPVVPVPLRVLWEDGAGFPLSACTAFQPLGHSETDVIYHHKRHQPGTWTRRTKTGLPFSVKSTDGRWMDRQRPLTTLVAEAITCTAVGDPEEVSRLLSGITAIGKERSRGLGGVREWRVEGLSVFDLAPDGRLGRSVPCEAAPDLGLDLAGQAATLGAWTPPHWQNGLYALVYPVGTVVGR